MTNKKTVIIAILLMLVMSSAIFAQRRGTLGSSSTETKVTQYTLTVNVEPDDATVYVNGDRYDPGQIQLDSGRYNLRITADGYEEYNGQINLTRNQTVNVQLQSTQFTLTVNVDPEDAIVFINGDSFNPGQIGLDSGRYNLRIAAEGYEDYSAQINLNRNQSLNINLQQILYSVRIDTNVPNAEIFVNNARQNSRRFSLTPGEHIVRLEAPGFQILTRRITVTGNEVFEMNLTPQTGYVDIEVPDSLRDFRVTIGEERYNRNQLENIALSPGTYVLRMDIGGLVGTVQFDVVSNEELVIKPIMSFQFDAENEN